MTRYIPGDPCPTCGAATCLTSIEGQALVLCAPCAWTGRIEPLRFGYRTARTALLARLAWQRTQLRINPMRPEVRANLGDTQRRLAELRRHYYTGASLAA